MAKIPKLEELHRNTKTEEEPTYEEEKEIPTETEEEESMFTRAFPGASGFFSEENDTSEVIVEEEESYDAVDELDESEIEEIVTSRFEEASDVTKQLSEGKAEIVDVKSIKRKIKLGGENNMNNSKAVNIFEKHGIVLVPSEIEVEKVITDEELKAFSNEKFEKAMMGLIGSGKSDLSGRIEIHVPAVQIENAIIRIIRASVETAAASGIDIKPAADDFINNIVGLTKTVLRDGLGKQTIKSFAEDIYETLLQTGMEKSTAEVNAINMASSYIGKDVFKLKNSSAGLPAEVLTLVVNSDVVPDEEDATFNLIIKGLINPIRSISDGEGTVKIALALDKILKVAQGTFKAEELLDKDVKFDTATLKAESGILTKVVYTIIKQGR